MQFFTKILPVWCVGEPDLMIFGKALTIDCEHDCVIDHVKNSGVITKYFKGFDQKCQQYCK